MRVPFQKLKGMEILAEKEGRLLGSVRRLQLDSKSRKAVGLVFKAKGISVEQWTRVSGIQRVGEDVIFLTDAKAVRDDAPVGRDARDMLGLSVTSLDGKRLGSLQDVVIETEGWTVAALTLDNGGEVDLGNKAVFGEDTILLRKGAAGQVRHARSQTSGFLSRVFTSDEDEPAQGPKQKSKKRTRRTRRK
jgi:sporulation protein YlmC with PRC-barrel domain